MTLLGLIILFVVVGLVLYLINLFVPMEAGVKNLLNIAVIIVLVVFLVQALGLLGPLNVPIGRVR